MAWPTENEFIQAYATTIVTAIKSARKIGLLPKMVKLAGQRFDSADPITVQTHSFSHEIGLHEIRKGGMVCLFVDMERSTVRKDLVLSFWDVFVNQIFLDFITRVATCTSSKGKLAGYRGDGAFFVWFYQDDDKTSTTADFDESGEALRAAVSCAANMNKAIECLIALLKSEDVHKSINETLDGMVKNATLSLKDAQKNQQFGPNSYFDLKIRVGIDVGELALTRVGLNLSSSELTLVGKNADMACKIAGKATPGQPLLSQKAYELYPKTSGGKIKFIQRMQMFEGIGNLSVYNLDEPSTASLVVIAINKVIPKSWGNLLRLYS